MNAHRLLRTGLACTAALACNGRATRPVTPSGPPMASASTAALPSSGAGGKAPQTCEGLGDPAPLPSALAVQLRSLFDCPPPK